MNAPARPVPPLRILCYAVNGLGLGHLTRLVAIMRHVRQLTGALGMPCEIAFLTSSEGDALAFAHDFPSFKLPSKTVVASGAMDPARYRRIAKQWVWNAVNLFAPDIFVVDTFPSGAFNELFDVLDFGQKNVFIYRAVRAEAASAPAFQSALSGYDRIILPREDGENDSPLPEKLQERAVATGPILIRSREETLTGAEAREMLGIESDAPAVYVGAGGGGDAASEAIYKTLWQVAERLPDVQFRVGAGGLYRGREFHRANFAWTRRHALMECFPAFDAAITAGGFNSVWELMHVGIPCVFLPQPRTHDDQERRVDRCVSAGAGILPPDRSAQELAAALQRLLEPETQARASDAARALVPHNHARQVAEEILELAVEPRRVEQAGMLTDSAALWQLGQEGVAEADALAALQTVWMKAARVEKNSAFPIDKDDADTLRIATFQFLQESHRQEIPIRKALLALRKARVGTPDLPITDAALAGRSLLESARHWLAEETALPENRETL